MSNQAIQEAVDELLAPMLEADGGTLELLNVDGDVVTLRLGGSAAVCSGARYTRLGLLQPMIEKAAGRPVHIKFERTYASPKVKAKKS